jgi:hypothetical protein
MPDPQDALQLAETLALTGATTVAAAMATDAWHSARTGTARLFHRSGRARQKAIEDQLDANAALVSRAPDADRARLSLVPLWQLELEDLLRSDSDAASEVQTLVEEIRAELPENQRSWVMNIIAKDQGHAYGAQGTGARVIVHQAPPHLSQSPTPQQDSGDAR